jgi:CheY-like chemotaxis protein
MINRPRDRTILVVEDDPVISEILRILLEDDGFQIVTALNGSEALERAREQPPDLITLDLMLPDMDGYRLLDELHGALGLTDIPVIVVSGQTYQPRPEDHVVAIIDKPFDATLLDRAIRSALLLRNR